MDGHTSSLITITGIIHFAASYGHDRKVSELIRSSYYPIAPGRASAAARSIFSGVIEEIPDIRNDADYQHGRDAKYRSIVAVPMLKDGRPIGTIAVGRVQTGHFPERQIDLLRTFADQAVIAIENARLFEEVQARTKELQEALEYQTALSNVLTVISRSPNDLQPVLDAIVETATLLCQADRAAIWRFLNGRFQFAAASGNNPEFIDYMRKNPPPADRELMSGRSVIEKRTPARRGSTEGL